MVRHRNGKLAFFLVTALAVFLVVPQMVNAASLLEYKGTSYYGPSTVNQLLSEIKVGTADVTINGFGVWGQPLFAENIKWVIFDEATLGTPVFLSSPLAVAAKTGTFATQAQWYDITLDESITLVHGHKYAMGLMADKSFIWGSSPDLGAVTITSNGLTLDPVQALVKAGVEGNAFVYPPTLWDPRVYSGRTDPAIRVSAPDPVPEPSTLILIGSGLMGLVAYRKRIGKV
ncbi:MAG: PEP-CTERM sorting domain-containing protein [Syntrophobacter sp.]